MCVTLARRFRRLLASRGFELVPLQTAWVRERFGLPDRELLTEMRLLSPRGETFGGADALLEIARQFWWAQPIRWLGRISFVHTLLTSTYRWFAARRRCGNSSCQVRASRPAKPAKPVGSVVGVLSLLALPLLTVLFAYHLEPWVFMWLMALALYAGSKWLTYLQATGCAESAGWPRAIGYLLAWPGMDARGFLRNAPVETPRKAEWVLSFAKTLIGCVLIWFVAREALPVSPLLAGWTGMIGVVFLLHFGLFHLLSLFWRRLGVDAKPLMRAPLKACSVAEFWSQRWNTAFHELAFRFAFRPVCRATSPGAATLLVFLLSGLVHEVVISLPARGGYGLPTLYFLIQGLGCIGEHTKLGRRLGLGHGLCGWIFTVLVTAGPAFWLFPPPFIRNVILPMLNAFGAT